MIAMVYDALKSAGAPEDKAQKAVEAIAGHEGRFAKVEAELTLLMWMVGFNLAATLGVVTLLLRQ